MNPSEIIGGLLALAAITAGYAWLRWKERAYRAAAERAETQRAQAQNQAENASRQVSRLLQVVDEFGQGANPREKEAWVQAAGYLTGARRCAFFELDSASGLLHITAARGFSPSEQKDIRIKPGEGAIGKAWLGTATIVAGPETSHETGVLTAPYLLVPVRIPARPVALLVVSDPEDGAFSTDAQRLSEWLATQASGWLASETLQREWRSTQDQIVTALGKAIQAKHPETHGHAERTRALVHFMTDAMPLPELLVRQIEYGAYLHDVGKIGIDEALLRKPEALTPAEYEVVKRHSEIGDAILKGVPFLEWVSPMVLYHQEWFNGQGYPEGLAGEEIPLGARIVSIIDAWDAMTSDRAYRKAMPTSVAVSELRRQAGAQFDPRLVDVFLRSIDRSESSEPLAAPR